MDKWWWSCTQSIGHYGPFDTRQQAIDEGMKHVAPNVKGISTGCGNYGPHFRIEWHRNETPARMEWLRS